MNDRPHSSTPDTSRSCPFHGDPVQSSVPERSTQRKTMVLTGASRGIGHATVKLFSQAGWRIITCSRHPFDREQSSSRCARHASRERVTCCEVGGQAGV